MIYAWAIPLAAVIAAGGAAVLPRALRARRYRKTNYRGRQVFAPGGLALIVPLFVPLLVESTRVVVIIAGTGIAMAVLGFVDDVFGSRRAGGLFGHARALVHGDVTTGVIKAVGGAVVGLAAAAVLGWRGPWIVVGGAVVALAANLANLFDLRPGRTIKVWVPCALALTVPGRVRVEAAVLLAAVVVFAVAELREEVMLGDTGANLLGGALGAASVATLSRGGLVVLVLVLALLTLMSERISFTRVIERTPPLRWLDELGRPSN